MQEMWIQSLCREDPLEEEMAPHSSILAWKVPWTEEPVGLQSIGSHRVGHDLVIFLQKPSWDFFYSIFVSGFQKNNNNKTPRICKVHKGMTLGSHIATLSSPSTDQSKPKPSPNSTEREIDSNSWWKEQQSQFAKGHVAGERFLCFCWWIN